MHRLMLSRPESSGNAPPILSSRHSHQLLWIARRLSNAAPLLAFCLLLFTSVFVASAQEATIVGTVTDPSGATVANAAITVTNTDRNQSRQLTSNDTGQFVVPDLQIGHYTVRVEAPGFKSSEHKDIDLQVGDRARMDF